MLLVLRLTKESKMPDPRFIIDLHSDLIVTSETEGSAKSCISYLAFWKRANKPFPNADVLITIRHLIAAGF